MNSLYQQQQSMFNPSNQGNYHGGHHQQPGPSYLNRGAPNQVGNGPHVSSARTNGYRQSPSMNSIGGQTPNYGSSGRSSSNSAVVPNGVHLPQQNQNFNYGHPGLQPGPPNYAAMSYADLVQYAEDQRRRIESNNAAIQQKEAKLRMLQQSQKSHQSNATIQARLKALRAEVTREDMELARLRKLQGELDQDREINLGAKNELGRLQSMFSNKERELRDAVGKVETLRGQLEQLQQRRKSAATAAMEMATRAAVAAREQREQKLAQEKLKLSSKQAELGLLDSRIEDMLGQLKQEKGVPSSHPPLMQNVRPKAAVEPFNITPPVVTVGLVKTSTDPNHVTMSSTNQVIMTSSLPSSASDVMGTKGYVEALAAVQDTLKQEEKSGTLTRTKQSSDKQGTDSLHKGTSHLPRADALRLVNGFDPSAAGSDSSSEGSLTEIKKGKMSPEHASLSQLKPRVQLYKPHQKSPSPETTPYQSRDHIDAVGNRPTTLANSTSRREPVVPASTATAMVPSSPTDKHPSPTRQKNASASYIHSVYTGKLRSSPQGSDQSSISSSDSETVTSSTTKSSSPVNHQQQHQKPPPVAAKPGKSAGNSSDRQRRLPLFSLINAESAPPDLIPESDISQFGMASIPEDSSGGSDSSQQNDKFYSHAYSDKLHIRSDNLRARKRNSWARDVNSGGSMSEAEYIKNLLIEERKKGRSIVSLPWMFPEFPKKTEEKQQPQQQQLQQPSTHTITETLQHHLPTPVDHSPQLRIRPEHIRQPAQIAEPEIRPPPPYPFHLYPEGQQKNRDDSSTSSDNDSAKEGVSTVEVDPDIFLPPPPSVGILKPPGKASNRGRIEFDPLALLLDAALEGELELVKKSAKKIKQVSLCNDEGITALHNAICAGHYEIVRFLVEANADVNAQDSDGWTPLHCAASCNNLPMVKFLVERGSCVFANTVSDHETPADKCEEDEDGFDGCYQFLLNIQEKMGHMNDSKVFSAYGYDAERDDELSFKEADEFVVINRNNDAPEIGWWWCRDVSSGKEGYIPRNYLALYPRLCHQSSPLNSSMDSKDESQAEDCHKEDCNRETSEGEFAANINNSNSATQSRPEHEEEEYDINVLELDDYDDDRMEEDLHDSGDETAQKQKQKDEQDSRGSHKEKAATEISPMEE